MLRFTLDTNCIIDAAQDQEDGWAVDRLISHALAGHIGLWLTTSAFEADQSRASDDHYQANLDWLRKQPLVSEAPGAFRLGLSTLGGPDVLTTDETAATDEKIKLILRPSYVPANGYPERKINDVHHLTAHIIAGHDVFVTRDTDMTDRREALKEQAGITVFTAPEAVRFVESHI